MPQGVFRSSSLIPEPNGAPTPGFLQGRRLSHRSFVLRKAFTNFHQQKARSADNPFARMFGLGSFVWEAIPGSRIEKIQALSCFRDSPGKYVALGAPFLSHVSQERSLINGENARMVR